MNIDAFLTNRSQCKRPENAQQYSKEFIDLNKNLINSLENIKIINYELAKSFVPSVYRAFVYWSILDNKLIALDSDFWGTIDSDQIWLDPEVIPKEMNFCEAADNAKNHNCTVITNLTLER